MGQDDSVLDQRPLPRQAVLKSGTLDTVSALARALPTQQGVVWFVLMNNDGDVEAFRKLQETFLGSLAQTLGTATSPKIYDSRTVCEHFGTALGEAVGFERGQFASIGLRIKGG
jgi:hypothetical protein